MMRKRMKLLSLGLAVALFSAAGARAHEEAKELPAGPLHDRHELMEGIGDHAKAINDTLKKGEVEGIAAHADAIAGDAKKITALFPEGSTHEKSRAKPEIWTNWEEFEKLAGGLHDDAAALAAAARKGDGVREAGQAMFHNCKSCHDQFRIPEE